MEVTQQMAIDHGEWVCAGCGQPIREQSGGGAGITHAQDCAEVSKIRAGAA
jgi:hypothetical protein